MITVAEVGLRIRKLRTERQMTVTKLASKIGISQSYLSDIENGKSAVPIEVLIHITHFFNVPLSDFFADKIENLDLDVTEFKRYADLLDKKDRIVLVELMKRIVQIKKGI